MRTINITGGFSKEFPYKVTNICNSAVIFKSVEFTIVLVKVC